MKKSHVIFSIMSIVLLAASPMEAMRVHTIETRANTQYKKFIEASRCFKKKGWKHCTPEQKARVMVIGLALLGIVGAAITAIAWKGHVRKLLKKGQEERDWMTPVQKASFQAGIKEVDEAIAELEQEKPRLQEEAVARKKEFEEWYMRKLAAIEEKARRRKDVTQSARQSLEEVKKLPREERESVKIANYLRASDKLEERQLAKIAKLHKEYIDELLSMPTGQITDQMRGEFDRRRGTEQRELTAQHEQERRELKAMYGINLPQKVPSRTSSFGD